MDYEDQGPDPHKVGGPAEHDERDGGLVVDEHLPEVLPLHIKELAEGQGPVEGHLHHVVEPDVGGDPVPGVLYEAATDVPEPMFVPEDEQAVQEDPGVEDKPGQNILGDSL